MRFTETEVAGVLLVEFEPVQDERGSFTRVFCEREFSGSGVEFRPVQASISHNRCAHTLRGMHYQVGPPPEHKLVRCTKGRIFDVAVDLRPDSPSYRRSVGLELSAVDQRALFIPGGCAHGFLTLESDTDVEYLISVFYDPARSRGVRWNDPALHIAWPFEPRIISPRDAGLPGLQG